MQYEKLLELLVREDVKELALQTDRPACVLVGDQYAPVMNRNLTEDEVIAAAIEAGGAAEVLHLLGGSRRWDFVHATAGTLRISAGYHGALLQVRVRQIAPPSGRATRPDSPAAPQPPPTPAGIRPSGQGDTRRVTAGGGVAPMGPPASAKGPPDSLEFGDMPPLMGNGPRTGERPLPPGARKLDAPKAPDAPRAPESAKQKLDALFSEPDLSEPANDVQLEDTIPKAESEPPPPAITLRDAPDTAFDQLLLSARKRRASDLHVIADRPVMFRIAGDLVPDGPVLPPDFTERLLLPQVPERARADLNDHGACDFALTHPVHGRFRCNVTRQRTGYKLTARPIGATIPTLADLGLPESIAAATEHHQGLIVITGPTGHGKTTTLAAVVDIINRTRSHHIITVEDPVEYVHPRKKAMMSQREVGTHTKTFFAALKGSLREDPDVIVVGELRDTETVRMALSASETGHLVISTMNTPSAAKAIERLVDLFPPGDQPQVRMTLAGGLRLVVSQRLVPTADRKGVAAAAELLPGTPALWALIRDNKTFQIPSLQQRGKALGIIRLDDSLADLVRSGKVTLEVAKEYAEAPDQLEALVVGKPKGPVEPVPSGVDPAQAAQKFGKDMFAKAGKLFGGDKK